MRPYRIRAISVPVVHSTRPRTCEAGPGRLLRPGPGTTPASWPFWITTVRCPTNGWFSLWAASRRASSAQAGWMKAAAAQAG
jgi:hypothetical protein